MAVYGLGAMVFYEASAPRGHHRTHRAKQLDLDDHLAITRSLQRDGVALECTLRDGAALGALGEEDALVGGWELGGHACWCELEVSDEVRWGWMWRDARVVTCVRTPRAGRPAVLDDDEMGPDERVGLPVTG